MENTEAFGLLRTIIRSAHLPVVDSFNRATSEARQSNQSGGSRSVFPMANVAVDHANNLLLATWDKLEPALDKLQLDWTSATLEALRTELRQMVDPTAALLFGGVRTKQAAFGDVVQAAEQRIHIALATHTQAVEAQLELYVANRRRKEIQAVLSELESRLVVAGQGDALLENVRGARREAETSSPDEGKLKQWLEVLSTGMQGINAASDLAPKVQMLIGWFL